MIAVSQFVARPAVAVVIAIPIALAVAVAFWWAVERPSHRLARRIRAGVRAESTTPAGAAPAASDRGLVDDGAHA